jgi:hypothetical protein
LRVDGSYLDRPRHNVTGAKDLFDKRYGLHGNWHMQPRIRPTAPFEPLIAFRGHPCSGTEQLTKDILRLASHARLLH